MRKMLRHRHPSLFYSDAPLYNRKLEYEKTSLFTEIGYRLIISGLHHNKCCYGPLTFPWDIHIWKYYRFMVISYGPIGKSRYAHTKKTNETNETTISGIFVFSKSSLDDLFPNLTLGLVVLDLFQESLKYVLFFSIVSRHRFCKRTMSA